IRNGNNSSENNVCGAGHFESNSISIKTENSNNTHDTPTSDITDDTSNSDHESMGIDPCTSLSRIFNSETNTKRHKLEQTPINQKVTCNQMVEQSLIQKLIETSCKNNKRANDLARDQIYDEIIEHLSESSQISEADIIKKDANNCIL
ncbi:11455_t:CDS:2, partial [Diversispora eburnea]